MGTFGLYCSNATVDSPITSDDSEEFRTIEIGDERIPASLIWEADFEPSSEWRVEQQKPGSDVSFEDGRMSVDCLGERGVTVWMQREFPEDLIIEYVATCGASEMNGEESKRNLNCFFCAADEAEPLATTARSGGYNEYHGWPNYIFTLTATHSRLRRDPGFEQVSELMLGAQNGERYEVQLVKRGGRITALVNGRVLHDWSDSNPHGTGWVGMRTYETDVTYDRWAVYGID